VNPSFFPSTSHHQTTPDSSGFSVRVAASQDLALLADLLALSFHSGEGFVDWLYPVLRLGIYEDLKNRLRSGSEHYICLVVEMRCLVSPTTAFILSPSTTLRINSAEGIRINAVEPSMEDGTHKYRSNRDECLVGTVEMALRSRLPWEIPSLDYPYLSNLAVHPEYRRLGVAQELLSNCEKTAREWGFDEIYLHVLENNHAARQLYYQAGYRLEQVDGHWSNWLLGQPRRMFLRKQL
jgi:ribosomal protein S18 acetylase RimI-like enzyme